MSKTARFWYGCFGSILPEVIRVYQGFIHQQILPSVSWKYLTIYAVISLVFMTFAGIFTIAWEPENAFKAVWVGASFPTLVSALIKVAPSLPTTTGP